jgi:hypothetical protein
MVDEWRIPKCPEKPERQQSELQEPEIWKNIETRNSQRVDYVRKTPKHWKEPELPKHRKLESSGRYPGTSTSIRRRVEDRCEIGDRNRYPLKGV